MTRLHAIAAAGLFSLLAPTLGAASTPAPAPRVEPSNGPWTYLAIFDGSAFFYDEASIRRNADPDGREYIAVWVLITERDGAMLVKLDTDCAGNRQRVGHIVQESAERKRTSQTPGVSEWGKTKPGQPADRMRKILCSDAQD